ncbi:MAG: cupin domain-containing protein [Litorilinea sp.]
MNGKFIAAHQLERDLLEWGEIGWVSRPSTTGAAQLSVLEATFLPGMGHNFHRHPGQEEVIYVIAGQVEQWLEQEHKLLGPGDSVFIGADVVHASFNVGQEAVKLMAILGPCAGEDGYVTVEVGDEAPWNTLRQG